MEREQAAFSDLRCGACQGFVHKTLPATPSFALAKPREDGKPEVVEVIRGAWPLAEFEARIEEHLGYGHLGGE